MPAALRPASPQASKSETWLDRLLRAPTPPPGPARTLLTREEFFASRRPLALHQPDRRFEEVGSLQHELVYSGPSTHDAAKTRDEADKTADAMKVGAATGGVDGVGEWPDGAQGDKEDFEITVAAAEPDELPYDQLWEYDDFDEDGLEELAALEQRLTADPAAPATPAAALGRADAPRSVNKAQPAPSLPSASGALAVTENGASAPTPPTPLAKKATSPAAASSTAKRDKGADKAKKPSAQRALGPPVPYRPFTVQVPQAIVRGHLVKFPVEVEAGPAMLSDLPADAQARELRSLALLNEDQQRFNYSFPSSKSTIDPARVVSAFPPLALLKQPSEPHPIAFQPLAGTPLNRAIGQGLVYEVDEMLYLIEEYVYSSADGQLYLDFLETDEVQQFVQGRGRLDAFNRRTRGLHRSIERGLWAGSALRTGAYVGRSAQIAQAFEGETGKEARPLHHFKGIGAACNLSLHAVGLQVFHLFKEKYPSIRADIFTYHLGEAPQLSSATPRDNVELGEPAASIARMTGIDDGGWNLIACGCVNPGADALHVFSRLDPSTSLSNLLETYPDLPCSLTSPVLARYPSTSTVGEILPALRKRKKDEDWEAKKTRAKASAGKVNRVSTRFAKASGPATRFLTLPQRPPTASTSSGASGTTAPGAIGVETRGMRATSGREGPTVATVASLSGTSGAEGQKSGGTGEQAKEGGATGEVHANDVAVAATLGEALSATVGAHVSDGADIQMSEAAEARQPSSAADGTVAPKQNAAQGSQAQKELQHKAQGESQEQALAIESVGKGSAIQAGMAEETPEDSRSAASGAAGGSTASPQKTKAMPPAASTSSAPSLAKAAQPDVPKLADSVIAAMRSGMGGTGSVEQNVAAATSAIAASSTSAASTTPASKTTNALDLRADLTPSDAGLSVSIEERGKRASATAQTSHTAAQTSSASSSSAAAAPAEPGAKVHSPFLEPYIDTPMFHENDEPVDDAAAMPHEPAPAHDTDSTLTSLASSPANSRSPSPARSPSPVHSPSPVRSPAEARPPTPGPSKPRGPAAPPKRRAAMSTTAARTSAARNEGGEGGLEGGLGGAQRGDGQENSDAAAVAAEASGSRGSRPKRAAASKARKIVESGSEDDEEEWMYEAEQPSEESAYEAGSNSDEEFDSGEKPGRAASKGKATGGGKGKGKGEGKGKGAARQTRGGEIRGETHGMRAGASGSHAQSDDDDDVPWPMNWRGQHYETSFAADRGGHDWLHPRDRLALKPFKGATFYSALQDVLRTNRKNPPQIVTRQILIDGVNVEFVANKTILFLAHGTSAVRAAWVQPGTAAPPGTIRTLHLQ
ncbi:hypothetical protein JCM10450v2_002857 [Rhodotorula kratochvilovae]